MRFGFALCAALFGMIAPAWGQGVDDARVLIAPVDLTLDGKVVGKLPAGDTVMVLDERDGQMFSAIGKVGWFPADAARTLEAGLKYFNQAIEKNPRDARAYVGRANIRFRQGDNKQAVVDYDAATRLDPSDPEPYCWRGWAWKRLGDDSKALADLNESIRLDPLRAPAWRIRGATYMAQKNYAECRKNYDRSVEIDPYDADLFNHRAVLLAQCPDHAFRDGALAVQDGRRACELSNWKVYHYISNLAVAYAQAGDMEQANSTLEKALKVAPPAARQAMSQVLLRHEKAKSP